MHFGCYGNLNFPLTYNGKSENLDLLLIADIWTNVLQKYFVCILSGPQKCIVVCQCKHNKEDTQEEPQPYSS